LLPKPPRIPGQGISGVERENDACASIIVQQLRQTLAILFDGERTIPARRRLDCSITRFIVPLSGRGSVLISHSLIIVLVVLRPTLARCFLCSNFRLLCLRGVGTVSCRHVASGRGIAKTGLLTASRFCWISSSSCSLYGYEFGIPISFFTPVRGENGRD